MEIRTVMKRSGSWVEAAGGLLVMSPFVVQFSGEELPCDVEIVGEVEDGVAVCSSIVLSRSADGSPIDAGSLRSVSFPTLMRHASIAATRVDEEDREHGTPFAKQDFIADTLRRKRRITTELLSEVAEIYKAAEPNGWPTKAVAEQLNTSRSTAATWVGLARKHTPPLLPPAKTAKKGSKS